MTLLSPRGRADGMNMKMTDMNQSIAVLIFGAIVVLAVVAAMIWRGRGREPVFVRIIGLSLIVIGAIFLTVVNVSSDRLNAAYALLGGAFGYLVARPDQKMPQD
jgi:dipeptide/tripeptide permease